MNKTNKNARKQIINKARKRRLNPNDHQPTNFDLKDWPVEPFGASPRVVISETAMLATSDFAICELRGQIGGVLVKATGSSKRFLGDKKMKADKPNTDVGLELALARALNALGKKVERQALGLSKHDEQMRVLKRAKKAKR